MTLHLPLDWSKWEVGLKINVRKIALHFFPFLSFHAFHGKEKNIARNYILILTVQLQLKLNFVLKCYVFCGIFSFLCSSFNPCDPSWQPQFVLSWYDSVMIVKGFVNRILIFCIWFSHPVQRRQDCTDLPWSLYDDFLWFGNEACLPNVVILFRVSKLGKLK